jgi:uroporphyrinogen-III synthase
MSGEGPLAGRRVALLEHRELDRLGHMLEEQGAETLRCPLVAIVDALDPAPVEAWLRRAIAQPFDDLVLFTGEGLRRLRGAAARAGLEAPFRDALGHMRTITRGPKPARALREIGLAPTLRAAMPTMDGVIAALSAGDLSGHRVGVQLYPDAPAERIVDFLLQAGAVADPIVPYAYVPQADSGAVAALIEQLLAGGIDVIAFTSASQVTRLFEAAAGIDQQAHLAAALHKARIAAVGPVVAGELARRGLAVAIMPRDSFFMKPLVSAIAAALQSPIAERLPAGGAP